VKGASPVTVENKDVVELLVDALSNDRQREQLLAVLRATNKEIISEQRSLGSPPDNADEGLVPPEELPPTATATRAFDGGLIGALTSSFDGSEEGPPGQRFVRFATEQLKGAAGELKARVLNGLGGQSTVRFLGWALPGWLAVVLLTLFVFRSRWLTERRTSRRNIHTPTFLAVRQVARQALFAILPIIMIGLGALLWVVIVAPSASQAQLFFSLVMPALLAAGAYMLGYLVLGWLIPSRGWRLVHYAQHRVLPWVAIIAGVSGLMSSLDLFAVRIALGPHIAGAASFILEVFATIVGVRFILRHRLVVRNLMIKRQMKQASQSANFLIFSLGALARCWHVLALALISANVISNLLGGRGSFIKGSMLSLLIVFLGLAAVTLANAVIAKSSRRLRLRRQRTSTRLIRHYLDIAKMLVRGAVTTVVGVAMVHLWGFDLVGWLSTEGGQRILRPLLSLIFVPVVLYAIWVTVDLLIARALEPSQGEVRHHSGRVATLLPLIRNLVFVALCSITVIAVLANLGIDVTPLLAGAGVVGLAFSFGAQQLVQDVITGFFIIFEDTIAIGDVVSTGDRTGTVEGLTIRTVRIRDGSGALHSIPFSQIKALQNNSRGFGIYPVNVAIAYDADPDKTMAIMRAIGQELSSDPAFGPKMLASLDIWGVDTFSSEGVTIKGAIKCQPLQQWGVGREFNRRLKHRLDEAGVRFQADQQRLLMRELYGATKLEVQ
jgi:small-conductance mechanosensitive channel